MTRKTKPHIIYGCECNSSRCSVHNGEQGYDSKTAPIVKSVVRNGRRIKVCSRCDLPSDTEQMILITPQHPFKPYFDYDPLIIGIFNEVRYNNGV